MSVSKLSQFDYCTQVLLQEKSYFKALFTGNYFCIAESSTERSYIP